MNSINPGQQDQIDLTASQLTSPPKRKKLQLWLLVFFLAACAIIAYMVFFSGINPFQTRPATPAVSVKAFRSSFGTVSQSLELPGEFLPYEEIELSAKVKGYLNSLTVDIGSHVKQGQLLATLDAPEVRDDFVKAKAAVEHARQQMNATKATANNLRQIYDRLAAVKAANPDLLAQDEVDQAKAKADSAESAVAAAEAALDEAQANAQQLGDIMEYTHIKAPFDGVITKLNANVGALVGDASNHGSGSSAIMHLSQLNRLRVVIKVPESVVPRIHEGNMATIRIPALSITRQLPMTRMSHEVDPDTRTMHVEIDYPNTNLAITPGIYADITLTIDSHEHVLAIPLEALIHRNGNHAQAFVFNQAHDALVLKDLVLGLENAKRIEVIQGLQEGDLVAIGIKPGNETGKSFSPSIIPDE